MHTTMLCLPDTIYLSFLLAWHIVSAARQLCSAGPQVDAKPLLLSLHSLPCKKRIKFKLLLIVQKCLNGIGHACLTELLSKYSNTESRQCLRSNSLDNLNIPRSNNKFGDSRDCFIVCGPKLFNSLPVHVRMNPTVTSFRKSLKLSYLNSYSIIIVESTIQKLCGIQCYIK